MSVLTDLKTQIKNLGVARFFQFDTKAFDQLLKKEPESFWMKLGQQKALSLFHQAAKNVPAYKDFLKKNKIDPAKIRSIEDFATVPLTDKKNYINAYSITERSWQGNLKEAKIIASSSGTSGEPKFWPRGEYQDYEAAIAHELFYRNSFGIDKYKTLLIIGFPMGVYVSGMATVLPSWLISVKGYPLTVISAGNNKAEVLRAIENLAPEYQQVVLVGHPFFIKDVLETGKSKSVSFSKAKFRLMFCSEGFTEDWRDYVLKLIHSNDPTDAFGVYGSSELLLMGYETEMSVGLRRKLRKYPKLLEALFGSKVVPNLFQFNPALRYIESVKNELVFTANSGLPLVRFNLHDEGKVISGQDFFTKDSWHLPLVGMWGRSDQTLVFYAANIYPEHIQQALQHDLLLEKLTGKFVMRKVEMKNLDQYLEINLELKDQVKPSKELSKLVEKRVVETLMNINMEYNFIKHHLEKDLTPRIILWRYQSETYFKPGLKPKYIKS